MAKFGSVNDSRLSALSLGDSKRCKRMLMMYPTFLCEFEVVVVVDVLLALLDEDAMFKLQNDLNSDAPNVFCERT